MRTLFGIIVLAALSVQGATSPPKAEPSGWCCLCMCHSVDESKCSGECIRMQHGTKIIEEPQMKSCTKSCLRQGVKQVRYEQDPAS